MPTENCFDKAFFIKFVINILLYIIIIIYVYLYMLIL